VLHQDESRLIASFEPSPQVAAPRGAFRGLPGNALGSQDCAEKVDCAGLIARWIHGINANVVLQPGQGFILNGNLGRGLGAKYRGDQQCRQD